MNQKVENVPVALITGAAKRLGATIAAQLHKRGYRVIVHYGRSSKEAEQQVAGVNAQRADSALAMQADVADVAALETMVAQAAARWGRLDLLVNNASTFYPTPLGSLAESAFDDLVATNLKAPLFLIQAARPHLARSRGSVVNIIDIHARRPLKNYSAYCAAKAGLDAITRSLAVELAPDVRVNGVAPGAILPHPDFVGDLNAWERETAAPVPMARTGQPQDIAHTVAFLASDEAAYVTGQIIAVDGGKSRA